VFQSYNLFPHYTALQNCSLALRVVKGKPKEEADCIASHVGTSRPEGNKVGSYPGIYRVASNNAWRSRGSLALNPSVMMFD